MYIYKVLSLVPCGLCGHYEGREDMKKELWLKVSSKEEYLQNEAAILSVLNIANDGADKVVLYCAKEKSVKALKYGVQVSEELTEAFTTLLGDQCVKVVEKHSEDQRHVPVKYPNIIQIIPCNDEIYAVLNEEDMGEEYRSKVVAFALCDDGCVYPLMFDVEFGISLLSDNEYVKKFLIKDNRITDSLEGINESLGALAECVDEVPLTSYAPGYTFFHIGGGVDTEY